MKKTFVIQVEYPDCDFVASDEIMEVTQECIENHLERYFGANIMDGDYDRIKVKEATDFLSLVKMMRDAQKQWKDGDPFDGTEVELAKRMCETEKEVDEYLKKMEDNARRKALEAENTEFDYGHNVKHYTEELWKI